MATFILKSTSVVRLYEVQNQNLVSWPGFKKVKPVKVTVCFEDQKFKKMHIDVIVDNENQCAILFNSTDNIPQWVKELIAF